MTQSIASFLTLDAVRNHVVELCGNVSGSRVLDAGCGDGLIGRALLPMVGSAGSVIFADHDSDAMATLDSEFRTDPAASCIVNDVRTLAAIPDASIDVLIIRAVLLYIPEKRQALETARRVLIPGGRLVISEPVNRYLYDDPGSLWGYRLRSIPDITEKMRHGFMEDASPNIRAMTDWTEHDLLSRVVDARFQTCRMQTVTEVLPGRPLPWLGFLHARWTPWMPTVAQVMKSQLDPEEQLAFETALRPLVEQGLSATRYCNTFITALTPHT